MNIRYEMTPTSATVTADALGVANSRLPSRGGASASV
jgi:hypothetical protein